MIRPLSVLALCSTLACSPGGEGLQWLDRGFTEEVSLSSRRAPPPAQPPVPAGSPYRTDSTPLVVDTLGASFVVDTDAGTVVKRFAGLEEVIEVGAGPTNLAIVGNRLFVTLRGARSVAILDLARLDLPPELVRVGAEPTAIVATVDASRVYVACTEQDRIYELDAVSLEVLASIPVIEPRFLAITPDATHLYAASARGVAQLRSIDLFDLSQSPVPLPATTREDLDRDVLLPLTPRISGSMSVSLDGARLLVPVLYADTTTPVIEISTPGAVFTLPGRPPDPGSFASPHGIGRLNPAIVEIDTTSTASEAFLVNVVAMPSSSSSPTPPLTASSYLSSVLELPDGRWLATMESSGAVLLVQPDILLDSFPDEPDLNGFRAPAAHAVLHNVGLNGLAFDGQGQALWSDGLSAAIGPVDLVELDRWLRITEARGMLNEPSQGVFMNRDRSVPLEVRQGRELFYSAASRFMGQGGVSCSTCHVEGRDDGLTWVFEEGPRQTPSLAGRVSDTTPVNWAGAVDTVATEIDITTRGRMGGAGLSDLQLAAVVAYVDWTPLPDTALRGFNNAAVARGQALFERFDVGCINCHSGPRFSDNGLTTIRGTLGNTPPLTGVAATSPYLQDGSAPTLRALLERSRDGGMGNTVSLTDAELDDLTLYLQTL